MTNSLYWVVRLAAVLEGVLLEDQPEHIHKAAREALRELTDLRSDFPLEGVPGDLLLQWRMAVLRSERKDQL